MSILRLLSAAQRLLLALCAALAATCALAQSAPLKVAVYDVAPYGHIEADGTMSGASVDLWRRVAQEMGVRYKLVAVEQMEAVLAGLERRDYDIAVGAITITPERLSRVDFSYPAHRSGVAAAFRRERGPVAAIANYAAVVAELAPLLAITIGLLIAMGVAMWLVERPKTSPSHESAVASLRDGVYWAVVTMTTVGYGDKTPKTTVGRAIAIAWMLMSVALVSILSTTIVSKMTADQVAGGRAIVVGDLVGRKLAAVAHSSGAEFLDARKLRYASFDDLASALTAVAHGEADAVVNSVGALQYAISTGFDGKIDPPQGVLAPAFIGFALQPDSALKKPLDRALIEVTASPEWRRVEASYFGP